MQTPFWSVEEVTRLRDMLDANKSTAEIALRLNRSTNAVRNKAKQLTSLRGKKHAARDDTAIERVAEGGERTCLQCGRIFVSKMSRANNRICPLCKNTDAWRVGGHFPT